VRIGATGPLLALAPDVEQAVVDADREPDQQHDVRRGVGRRRQPAREAHQPHRRDHRRDREADRQQRRHQRAERHQHDPERHGQGRQAQAVEDAVHLRTDEPVATGLPRLRDAQVRVGLLHAGDGRQRRVEVVLVDQREGHQRGRAVLRRNRVGPVERDTGAVESGDQLVQRGRELRVVDRAPLALDEDHLALVVREAGVGDQPFGAGRLPVRTTGLVLHGAGESTEDGGGHHEHEPADHRQRPMARAPARRAGRDPLDFHHVRDATECNDRARSGGRASRW
jgi:hypothetical protein